MLNIGVDVDGVLADIEKYQLKYGKKYFNKIDEKNINYEGFDIREIFNCTNSEREKFWIKYIWNYCIKEPARKNASIVLRKLHDEGNKIYIITGRAHVTENNIVGEIFRKMLYAWLYNEKIPYDDITLCSEKDSEVDKYAACQKYNIDVMIEDKYENVMRLQEITKVLCFDAKYNQKCIGNNIIRVYSFNEVYNQIKTIEDINYFQKLENEKVNNLTSENKIQYYKNLREYYQNLPFDRENNTKLESNYIKLSKFATPIFNKIFSPKVFNRELVPNESGLIFVANHNNYYDQFPIIVALGDHRPIHFLTATKMLNMKRGIIYLKTGAVSVDRENKEDRHDSSVELKKIVANGGNIFIFPEGRTNRGEAFLLDFHPGAVAIAQELGSKIVPVAVNDNYKKQNGELCVRFGNPISIAPTDDVMEKTEDLKEIIAYLKQQNIDYVQEQQKIKRLQK
ncbi:MAG: hypothetical protein HFI86_02420 [Bacilli bacterium]|nr:hypothetical protein [Bacilli bacterium]